MKIEIVKSEDSRSCWNVPRQNQWGGIFCCDRPTYNLVTITVGNWVRYKDSRICDSCIKEIEEYGLPI